MVDVGVRYDPFDAEILNDPYPTYRMLRDTAPVFRAEESHTWVLSRHADVQAAALDHGTYSSVDGIFPTPPGSDFIGSFLPMMIVMDPPRHDQLRALVSRAFTPRRVAGLQFLVMFGGFFLLVQYLQLVVGYAPFQSAVALTPLIVPIVVISLIAPRLAERYGLRVVTAPGMLLIAVGLYLVSRLGVEATYPDFLGPLLAMGAGLGLITAPATTAIVAATPVEKHGVAAAVNDASREIGAAVGVAIAGSVLAAGYADRIEPALATVAPPAREPISDSLAAALQVAQHAGPYAEHVADIARAAFVHGNSHAALAMSAITAVSALILGIWARGRPPATTRRRPNTADDVTQCDSSTESSTR